MIDVSQKILMIEKELQNDYTKLMVDLEKELHALHQHYAESGQAQKDIDEYEARIDQERLEKKQKEIDEMNRLLKEKAANIAAQKAVPIPFCEITVVIEHSPAYNGGTIFSRKKLKNISQRLENK